MTEVTEADQERRKRIASWIREHMGSDFTAEDWPMLRDFTWIVYSCKACRSFWAVGSGYNGCAVEVSCCPVCGAVDKEDPNTGEFTLERGIFDFNDVRILG